MGEAEIVLNARELGVLRIGCGKCGTKILFDCAADGLGVPDHCPSCSTPFGEKASWISGYRKWFAAAATCKELIFQFQIKGN